MKPIIKLLQNPFIKILISPLASIMFGTLYGIYQTNQIQWTSLFLLILIIISTEIINHIFFIRYDRGNSSATPNLFLYIAEAILFLVFVMYAIHHHWIVNVLLLFHIAYIHLQYWPANLSATFYQLVLSTFFNGFVLNIVAFYTQTFLLTDQFMLKTVPLIIVNLALFLFMMNTRYFIIHQTNNPLLGRSHYLVFATGILAIFIGFYLSLPSQSYYFSQILFFIISFASMIPILIETKADFQLQNKINYMYAICLIFSVFYSLSQIF